MGIGWSYFGGCAELEAAPKTPGVNQGKHRGVTKSPKRKRR